MIPEPQKTYLLELLTTLDPAADEFVLVGGQTLKFAFCWASINVMAKWLFVQSSPILSTIPSCRLRQLFQSRERVQGVKLTLQDNTLKIASKSTGDRRV